ncbi:OmpA family protein [Streptomonospora nanhaiensis]|uniref:OmpA family protein n=1 Tax=Streptomonospora nanhaiensis TaxID=1323731 RepID=UPI001C992328|nr:OmpA family protein [Streptomonospora nanhaiensis]MBX9388049.1 OmpA family protein [Streptomonospora nanhaiensis]
MTFYTVHPAPAGTDTATVFTDAAPPFVDVPVTDRAPSAPEGQTLRMPEDVPAAEPDTLAWGTAVEAADASQAVRTDAESTSIDLSADVLFATNESEPSAEAEEVLARTAEQIDASGAAEVTVAGHTDDTGNDAINDPLSRERAENVTSALEDLVAVRLRRTPLRQRHRGGAAAQPPRHHQLHRPGAGASRRLGRPFAHRRAVPGGVGGLG